MWSDIWPWSMCMFAGGSGQQERRQSDSWQPCSHSNSRLPAVLTFSGQQDMTHSTSQWPPVMCLRIKYRSSLVSLCLSETWRLKGPAVQSTCEYAWCFTNNALQEIHVCCTATRLWIYSTLLENLKTTLQGRCEQALCLFDSWLASILTFLFFCVFFMQLTIHCRL